MKKFISYAEFEKELKCEEIPEFNEDDLIRKLRNCFVKNKKSNLRLKIILISAIIISLILSSVAFGEKIAIFAEKTFDIISSVSVKNDKGEVELEYSKIDLSKNEISDQNKIMELNKKYSYIMDKEKRSLGSDESELFMITEVYEIHKTYQILNNKPYFYDINELIKNAGIKIKTPSVLPKGFRFHSGYIEYGLENIPLGNIAEELYSKAKSKGKDYMAQKFKTSKNAAEIILHYKTTSNNSIDITINGATKYISQDIEGHEKTIEKIMIGSREVLYITIENSGAREIIFTDNAGTGNRTYEIQFPPTIKGNNDMKSSIIEMIKSMN